MKPASSQGQKVHVRRTTPTLLGWPSDAFAIDTAESLYHTVLVFIPGNPGLIEWYIPMFTQLIEQLGPGYCARGVSNAGHALETCRVDNNESTANKDIAWTVDGQSLHKALFVDTILDEEKGRSIRLIFVCHSIGTYFAQRMLLFRPDILARTSLLIGLMPFIRMKGPWDKQAILDIVASKPEATIRIHQGVMKLLATVPTGFSKFLLRGSMRDPEGLKVAARLVQIPQFARNFFLLGAEEIRDVPECIDQHVLRYLDCPFALLFAAKDHWAPVEHIRDLEGWKRENPNKILSICYNQALKHDFVSIPEMVPVVVEFCFQQIKNSKCVVAVSRL